MSSSVISLKTGLELTGSDRMERTFGCGERIFPQPIQDPNAINKNKKTAPSGYTPVFVLAPILN